jgi:hypothetical protein
MKTVLPAVPSGTGTQTALGGVVLAWLAAIGAIISAIIDTGSDFYTQPGVTALVATAVVATIGFFGGRSYQAGQLYKPVDPAPVADDFDYAAEALPSSQTDVSADDVNGGAS